MLSHQNEGPFPVTLLSPEQYQDALQKEGSREGGITSRADPLHLNPVYTPVSPGVWISALRRSDRALRKLGLGELIDSTVDVIEEKVYPVETRGYEVGANWNNATVDIYEGLANRSEE